MKPAIRFILPISLLNLVACSNDSDDKKSPLPTGPAYEGKKILLNDTGITFGAYDGYDGNGGSSDACGDGAVATAQDCAHGRDATDNDNTNGYGGFSFTRLDADGDPLADQGQAWDDAGDEAAGTQWSCVKDDITGLYWEVKVNDTSHLRHKDWNYTYYDSRFADTDNSDDAGTGGKDGIWAGPKDDGIGSGSDNCGKTNGVCTTQQYITDINEQGLCGHKDWRLPTHTELQSIINYANAGNVSASLLDDVYFVHTIADNREWTSTAYFLLTDAEIPAVYMRYTSIRGNVFKPLRLDGGDANEKIGIRLVRHDD